MKQERKFRFVGDPKDYHWDNNPIHGGKYTIDDLDMPEAIKEFPEDWEEVTEPEQIPNQDQPASEMTKFEMAVFMVLQGMVADKYISSHLMPEKAIKLAKDTFKQLDELK